MCSGLCVRAIGPLLEKTSVPFTKICGKTGENGNFQKKIQMVIFMTYVFLNL